VLDVAYLWDALCADRLADAYRPPWPTVIATCGRTSTSSGNAE
jgi:hypothetical protein